MVDFVPRQTLSRNQQNRPEPSPLRRTRSQAEDAIRREERNYFPSTGASGSESRDAPSCALPSGYKSALPPPEKKIAKSKFKHVLKRVVVPFPPMNAPFGGPSKHEKSKGKVMTFVLNFRDEEKGDGKEELRVLLGRVQNKVSKLIEHLEPTGRNQNPLSVENGNTLIRPGLPHKDENGSKKDTNFPDYVQLKMYLEDVKWTTVDGDVMNVVDIDFSEYDVQPTVEVRDVWIFDAKFYVRLMATECLLHPREMGPITMLPDYDEETADVPMTLFDGF